MTKKLYLIIGVMIGIMCSCSQHPQVIITAHRGGAGIAPENTMAAIKMAMEIGVEFSEIDVQETADGKIILLHDDGFKRTGLVNRNIWQLDADTIQSIDVGKTFNEKFAGETAPFLTDVIDAVDGKMMLNIELKYNDFEKELAGKVLKILEEKNFEDKCIITSFNLDAIKEVRKNKPELKVGYIFSKYPKDEDVFTANVDLLSVKYKLVDEDFVKKAHANGKEVHVWTVNDPEMMKKLIKLGVDSIITNFPDVLKEVISEL